MGPMRAIVVLAAILSLAAPQVSFASLEARTGSAVVAIAAPGAAPAQALRAPLKTDKTFGGCWAATEDSALLHPSRSAHDVPLDRIEDAPNVDLQGPPLAPRPPPV
jgi:hypothetical protein